MIHKKFLLVCALLPPITVLARQLSPAANPGGHSPRELREQRRIHGFHWEGKIGKISSANWGQGFNGDFE